MTNVLILPPCPYSSLALVTDADFRQTAALTADLTGIAFHQQIRLASDTTQLALDLSTDNGMLVNHGASGHLSWLIPASAIAGIAPGAYVADLIARADGAVINLCPSPMQVTVTAGLTF